MGNLVDTDRLSTYDEEYVAPYIKGQETLTRDSVGWTGKNLIPYPYRHGTSRTANGVTFTVNEDGSITANGTSTSNVWFNLVYGTTGTALDFYNSLEDDIAYKVSGIGSNAPAKSAISVHNTPTKIARIYAGEEATFTKDQFDGELNSAFNISVGCEESGVVFDNFTFYPMIRRADILDDTYEPYHQTVEEELNGKLSEEANNLLGSKNLLPYPPYYTNVANPSGTYLGMTHTINEDGSVTLNGTQTSTGNFTFHVRVTNADFPKESTHLYLKAGKYTFSIGKEKISGIKMWLSVTEEDGTSNTLFQVEEQEYEFTLDRDDYYGFGISITKGTILNNVTFYPMIRLAEIEDDTYEEYAATNQDLSKMFRSLGMFSNPMPAYIARTLPILKRDITDAYYNGNLKAEIVAGNFKNVRVGDYIVGKTTGTIYYVVDLDYWWNRGDSTNTTTNPIYGKHHITIMPYRLLTVGDMAGLWAGYGLADKSWRVSANDKGRCPWNAATDVDPTDTEAIGTNSTTIERDGVSGYLGSYVKTYALKRYYEEWLVADFGEANVFKYRNWLGNKVNADAVSGADSTWKGMTSGVGWVDSYCDLPSEPNLYGGKVASSSYRDIGAQKEQLAIFRQASIFDFWNRMDLWTKAVASTSLACYASSYGSANASSASYALWVCPLAHIK